MIYCLRIVATENLLEIILAHVAIAFQVLNYEFNLFPGIFNLLRAAA